MNMSPEAEFAKILHRRCERMCLELEQEEKKIDVLQHGRRPTSTRRSLCKLEVKKTPFENMHFAGI
jgi:hypothetical protein